MEQSVRFLRMNTGEDIIAEVVEVEKDDEQPYFVLINPLKLVYLSNVKPNMIGVTFMQWVFRRIVDIQEFTIYPNDVLTIAVPSEDIIDYYWSYIDHISNPKENSTEFEFLGEDIDDYYPEGDSSSKYDSESDLLQQINDLLDTGKNKRKLH